MTRPKEAFLWQIKIHRLHAYFFLGGVTLVFSLFISFSALSESSSVDKPLLPLPIASNLQSLGNQALKENLPIAILFGVKGLKSSVRLKEEAILPSLFSGQFDSYVLMTEIHVNDDLSTIDFYGEKTSNIDFKDMYNLSSLPVVIFVNGEGEIIHEQLLSGAYDFYYYYLKQFINESLITLNNPKQIP